MIDITLALPTFTRSGHFLLDAIKGDRKLQKFTHSYTQSTGLSFEAMLFKLLTFAPEERPPYAAISAIGNDFAGDQGWWLRVDPVELLVDAGNICLVGRDHLRLEDSEANQLMASLNSLLKEDNLLLHAGTPQEWYLHLPAAPLIATYPLYEVIAKDIRAYLPFGAEQKWWHKLFTELQMLLFNHDVNLQRQSQNKPIINSVWPWGEGEITKPYPLVQFNGIWTDSFFVKGMHMLSNQEIPFYFQKKIVLQDIKEPGNYLITMDHHQYDSATLNALLTQLIENTYDRHIRRLTLYLGNGSIYRWQAPRFRFFIPKRQ